MPRPKKPTCLYCNRKFDRPQGKAAHERMCDENPAREANMAQARAARQAHASPVKVSSGARTATRRSRNGSSNGSGNSSNGAANGHSNVGRLVGVDSYDLLPQLFPDGLPADREVLVSVSEWVEITEGLKDLIASRA